MSAIVAILYYERKYNTKIYNQYLRDTTNPFNISDRFIDNYRLPKHVVHQLIDDIQPYIDDSDNNQIIPLHLEVLAALNFYASGRNQRRVGLDALAVMSQSRVSSSIKRISKVIGARLVDDYIVFPDTIEEANIKKTDFQNKYGVPGIIGLIDCTHIAIAKINKEDEHAYVNRKGYRSINTQMMCDAQLRILAINARYAGSNRNSHIWGGSAILPIVERLNLEDNQTWLFGDNAYALRPYLMVPYRVPTTATQKRFNKQHAKIRSSIERCSAVLKNRFRCLLKSSGHLNYNHERSAYIIYTCAVLHNILIDNNYPVDEIGIELDEEIVPIAAMREGNKGEANRQFLANYFEEHNIN